MGSLFSLGGLCPVLIPPPVTRLTGRSRIFIPNGPGFRVREQVADLVGEKSHSRTRRERTSHGGGRRRPGARLRAEGPARHAPAAVELPPPEERPARFLPPGPP